MVLTCPHCGFSKDVNPSQMPQKRLIVTCPRCKEGFSFDASAPAQPAVESEASETPGLESAQIPEPDQPPLQVPREEDLRPRLQQEATGIQDAPKAGFWIRLVASVVDSIVVTIVQFILGLALGLVSGLTSLPLNEEGQVMMGLVTSLLGMTLAIAYYVFFTGYCGQTPGKMAVRIKVVCTDGSHIGYGRAFLREVPGKFISSIILGIGYLMVAFDAQKQGLHDKIASTYVVKL